MRVSIIIPTYDRLESVKKTINSLLLGNYKNIQIYVVIDGNKDISLNYPNLPIIILRNEKRMDWIFSINRTLREMNDTGAAIYASDDLNFPPYAISRAVAAMRKYFPDTDGIISLKQSCLGVDSAFGLMGEKFIERFPNRQVLCPDYIHYVSDVELGKFAKSIDKFRLCEDVILEHDRPTDKTRELGLNVLTADRATEIERVHRGFLWGKTFERVNND